MSYVVLKTSMGSMTLELYTEHAPKTCHNFVELVKRGYYDGTILHRVIPNFMIQGGDPTGTGYGGQSIYGQPFEDEKSSIETLKHTGGGVLSMANSGANTNGSQFFITLAPTPWLDGKHAVFGRVFSGMETVERISKVTTGEEDRPVDDVVIVSASINEDSE